MPPFPEGLLDRLQAFLDTGDREAVLTTHYREVAGMSLEEIEMLKDSQIWPSRLAIAHTLPRELRAEENYQFDPQRFKELQIPTLLLQGSDSPTALTAGIAALATVLSNSRTAIMPGQQHIAMYTGPKLFVSEVVQFLLEPL